MSETNTKMIVREAGTTTHKDMAERAAQPSFTKVLKNTLNLETSEFCKINWYYPGGREAFPGQPRMWTVDRCYPHHKDGVLLVDTVMLPHKRAEAKMKHIYFNSEKFKKENKTMKYIALDRSVDVINFDEEIKKEEAEAKKKEAKK